MYLSPVPFEKLGFPTLKHEAVTINAGRAMSAVPVALIAVAALMSGTYWVIKRRNKLNGAPVDSEGEKEGVTK